MDKGNWLDDLLEDTGVTASQLSKMTGIDSAVISNIRSGRRGVGPDVARKIAHALKVPEETLFRKAGLLEKKSGRDKQTEEIEQIVHVLEGMTKEEQQEYLSYLRFMQNRKKK